MPTYKKLEPQFKVRWLKALRSGRYKQTDGQLGKKNKNGKVVGFCCLGVAACSLRVGKWVMSNQDFTGATDQDLVIDEKQVEYNSLNSGSFPEWLRDKVGLSESAESHLIKMNDEGHSFDEIADWIERNL